MRDLAYLFHRWILHRPHLIAEIPAFNLRFKVRTPDRNGRHLCKYRRHETELTRFLCRNLRLEAGDVIIDIGANMGWCALLIERLASARVDIFAFEPDPDNFGLLTENLALNGIHHGYAPAAGGESVSVATVALDDFWQSRGLDHRVPRFIKIDVEGYELMALRGARGVLARFR